MLATIRRRLWKLLRNEDGPTAVEYAVMLALVIVVCLAAITSLGTTANDSFSTTASAVGTVAGSGEYTGPTDGNENGKGQF